MLIVETLYTAFKNLLTFVQKNTTPDNMVVEKGDLVAVPTCLREQITNKQSFYKKSVIRQLLSFKGHHVVFHKKSLRNC